MKKNRLKFSLILTLFVLMIFALAACAPSQNEDPGDAKPPAEEETEVPITVTPDDLDRYATESSTIWEFLQRFYTDTIVYKDIDGKYMYEPVNFDLPLSDYNWDYLVQLDKPHKELEYVESGETLSIKGIDVSRYQKTIDWQKAAADGVKYAIIRVGYRGYDLGGLIKDDLFDANATAALQNNVAVGVYFVTQAITVEEAIQEAEFVIESLRPYNITWPVVLDIEEAASVTARTTNLTKEQRTDFAIAFCETIKEAGYTPMLYCNIRWFIQELDLERLTEYDKWLAQYFNRPFFPYELQMWQYTSSGRVDGITGNVDLNLSFVDYSDPDRDESEE